MNRESVISSDIQSIGYDPSQRILEIEFTNGAIYQYFDIPKELYDGLIMASSHGKYLHQFIKRPGYTYQRVN